MWLDDGANKTLTCKLGDAGEHAGYEALVVLAGRCDGLMLLVGRHVGDRQV